MKLNAAYALECNRAAYWAYDVHDVPRGPNMTPVPHVPDEFQAPEKDRPTLLWQPDRNVQVKLSLLKSQSIASWPRPGCCPSGRIPNLRPFCIGHDVRCLLRPCNPVAWQRHPELGDFARASVFKVKDLSAECIRKRWSPRGSFSWEGMLLVFWPYSKTEA